VVRCIKRGLRQRNGCGAWAGNIFPVFILCSLRRRPRHHHSAEGKTMRTLTIIILLTSAICYGQGHDSTLFIHPYNNNVDTSTSITRTPYPTWMLLTLEDIDAYWQECWNDSTKHDRCNDCDYSVKDVERRYPYCSDDLKRMICTDTTHLHFIAPRASDGDSVLLRLEWIARFYYTHREPTFTGFREWMRRKK
jgi:hypothetical protein